MANVLESLLRRTSLNRNNIIKLKNLLLCLILLLSLTIKNQFPDLDIYCI